MRVITFDRRDARQLQAAIQQWLDEHKGATIHAMAQSHDANNDIIVTILYAE